MLFAKAIADENRQAMMKLLCCATLNVTEIVEGLGGRLSQPTVTHHLQKLEEAGLVVVRQEGRHRFYTLNQEVVTYCCGVLMRSFAPNFTSTFAGGTISVEDIG